MSSHGGDRGASLPFLTRTLISSGRPQSHNLTETQLPPKGPVSECHHLGGGSGLRYVSLEGDAIQPIAVRAPLLEEFMNLRGKSLIHTRSSEQSVRPALEEQPPAPFLKLPCSSCHLASLRVGDRGRAVIRESGMLQRDLSARSCFKLRTKGRCQASC